MDDTPKVRAEELTEKAIARAPITDFRPAYRERLRWLKDNQPQAFSIALGHYNDVLVPNIANGAEPISEWIEYGKRLAELSGKGKVLRVDETGRADDFTADIGGLVLYVPDDTAIPALALAVPREPSDAQRATLELLIRKVSG